MQTLSRPVCFCLCLVLSGSLLWAQPKPPVVSNRLRTKLGAKAIAILQAPTKVEVFRIDPRFVGKDDDKHILGYAIKATGKEQESAFGLKLAALVLQDRAWFNPDKFSVTNPSVGYRVWKDRGRSILSTTRRPVWRCDSSASRGGLSAGIATRLTVPSHGSRQRRSPTTRT
jgi:hypothetical protein